MFKYNFIYISETHLDLTISSDNNNLNISRYNLIRADHPSNSKGGGVCIYYKESLVVRSLNKICLPERPICKVCLGKKKQVTYRCCYI